ENKRPQPFPEIQPEQVETAFAQGLTILAYNICDLRLSRLGAAFKAQLNHLGDVCVHASLSPCSFGAAAHFDKTSAFFIQCEGSRRYLVSEEPVLGWPLGSAVFAADGTGQYFDHDAEPWEEVEGVAVKGLTEVVLEPGDVLFVPAGAVHATQAVNDYSLN